MIIFIFTFVLFLFDLLFETETHYGALANLGRQIFFFFFCFTRCYQDWIELALSTFCISFREVKMLQE